MFWSGVVETGVHANADGATASAATRATAKRTGSL
jgi:hypothetical protein